MKKCSTCAETKALSEFGKNSCKADGLCAACKNCRNARRKAFYYKNPEKSISQASTWNKANRARRREAAKCRYAKAPQRQIQEARRYYAENTAAVKAYQKQYRADNPARCKSLKAKRRARKAHATPGWLTQFQVFEISLFYAQASLMTKQHAKPYHVDHIVPLKGKDVCGLHVPWNLQVITGVENSHKKNKIPIELQGWRATTGELLFD